MNLFHEILMRKEFHAAPPVLIDIGASGALHKRWKAIAPYSVCIVFDGDDREFGYVEKKSTLFKKLYVFHSIVTDEQVPETDFYLTTSPFCSSVLEPDANALKSWAFSKKFGIEKKVRVKATRLDSALRELHFTYVDWFKSDSQGLDLRLFRSLNVDMQRHALAAEFEPGIIDAYKGEEKFSDVLRYMDGVKFWMADAKIKGSQRLSVDLLSGITANAWLQKIFAFSHNDSPGWIELVYMNSFQGEFGIREYLLGWVFATILQQHGFALELALKANQLFHDPLFVKMGKSSRNSIKKNVISGKLLSAVFEKITKVFTRG